MGKIGEAQNILRTLGLPTAQQNEMSALTLLALVNVKEADPWSSATRHRCTVTKTIMAFMNEVYEKSYAPNTRETVRRQVLHQFVQAGLAEYNAFEPDLPTNSPKAHYAVSEEALAIIRKYGTPEWEESVSSYLKEYGSLKKKYLRPRSRKGKRVPVRLPDGREYELSPGKHNVVQAAIIEEFAPRFAPGSKVLYLGDTAKKNLFIDKDTFEGLKVDLTDHDKLPDVVLLDEERNWLFLIEAVTSHGPVSPKRVVELQEMFSDCSAGLVFVTAFPDMTEFRKHMKDIAWETEVWLMEIPDHMIHYNGDRFLGPR